MNDVRISLVFQSPVLKISVVEGVTVLPTRLGSCYQVLGKAEPLAVIITDPDGSVALDLHGKPLAVDELPAELWSSHQRL